MVKGIHSVTFLFLLEIVLGFGCGFFFLSMPQKMTYLTWIFKK